MCRGRLKLVVTDTRDWRQTYLDCWTTREELIDACMATAHVPFFLDLRLSAPYRRASSALCVCVAAVASSGICLHGCCEAGRCMACWDLMVRTALAGVGSMWTGHCR